MTEGRRGSFVIGGRAVIMKSTEEARERKSRKRDWEQVQSEGFVLRLVDLGWESLSQECLVPATVPEPS